MNMQITEPKSPEEFQQYYHLRWKILRQPWGEPVGSERDELEGESIHVMVVEDCEVLGVGRGHLNSVDEGQIRYMAVEENQRGKGIGEKILMELERRLRQRQARCVVLDARESAVGFYEKYGYEVVEKGHTLFGEVGHFRMKKEIN